MSSVTNAESRSERFEVVHVPATTSRKTTTKAFLARRGMRYLPSGVFHELTEPANVSSDSQLAAQNVHTGTIVTGRTVRLALDLPSRKKPLHVEPEAQPDFRIFVKCDSPAKNIVPDTFVLLDKFTMTSAGRKTGKRSSRVAGLSTDDDSRPSIVPRRSERLRAGVARKSCHPPTPLEKHPVTPIRVSKPKAVPAVGAVPTAPERRKPSVSATASAAAARTSSVIGTSAVATESQLVFSFDTTGSMASCLQKVKNDIQATVTRLLSSVPGLSIAVIAHGDYCDADTTYVIKMLDFTRDAAKIRDFVRGCEDTFGGDFDECYELALHDARTKLSWRDSALKSLVLIGDATPHEPEYEMNVENLDWKRECDRLREAAVKVYAVRCLSWGDSGTFYKEVARRTGGHYLELHQLHAVADFLVAISLSSGAGGKDALLMQFRDEVRSRYGGLTRNMRDMFRTLRETDEGDDDDDEVGDADLDAVEPGRFQLLDVPARMNIQEFVKASHAVFQPGKAFYEFTKPEIISDRKEIVLLDRCSGDMFTGPCARGKAGIPPADGSKRRIKPPASDRWVLFVQSTSYNRVLVAGTRFLYEIA